MKNVRVFYTKRFSLDVKMSDSAYEKLTDKEPEFVKTQANIMDDNTEPEFESFTLLDKV
jgi:hypothetical protein